jgi:DNA transformation protein
MVATDSFAEFLREQLAPLGLVRMRRMFGKTGVFCDGLMLGMVTDNTLYLRVDDLNRANFKEAEAFHVILPDNLPISSVTMDKDEVP